MDITDEYIDNFVEKKWAELESEAHLSGYGAIGDSNAARDLLEDFIEKCDKEEIFVVPDLEANKSLEAFSCLKQVKQIVENVLNVDMSEPSNRKGALPKALGLVSRKDGYGANGDSNAARDLLEDFIERYENLEFYGGQNLKANECLEQIKQIVENVLNVDMSKPSNRKGALPKALGLVSRKDAEKTIRDQVIFETIEHLQFYTGVDERKKSGLR